VRLGSGGRDDWWPVSRLLLLARADGSSWGHLPAFQNVFHGDSGVWRVSFDGAHQCKLMDPRVDTRPLRLDVDVPLD